jgi:hypothetical protein
MLALLGLVYLSRVVQHWEPITRRVLEAASPEVIVEIGARHGDTTTRLLSFAAGAGCVVHSIDPEPSQLFDLDGLKRTYGDRFFFHRALSLDALPGIDRIDAVLIDGDHNWYTVYNELQLLSRQAEDRGHDFPVAILHDVGWPYDRRDQYCNPDAIPEQYRQPFRRGGLSPSQPDPIDGGGMHASGYHALEANTARNGVRTAVEDFLAADGRNIRFHDIVGFNGLGILVSAARLERTPRLRSLLDEFSSPEWLREQCTRIEAGRVQLQVRLEELGRGGPLKRWARGLRDRLSSRRAV